MSLPPVLDIVGSILIVWEYRRPQCSENTNVMDLDVRIAYYGMWGWTRKCGQISPENLPAGALTHINIAFAYISETHEVYVDDPQTVTRVARLKRRNPGLRVNIAIGKLLGSCLGEKPIAN